MRLSFSPVPLTVPASVKLTPSPSSSSSRRIDDKPALASLRGKRSIEEVYFIDGLDTPESANKHPKLPVEDDADTVDGAPAALWYEWLYTATQGDEDTDFVPKLTAANLNSHTGSIGAGPAANNQCVLPFSLSFSSSLPSPRAFSSPS